jgi:peptide/nickel transport system substrate-binding protein
MSTGIGVAQRSGGTLTVLSQDVQSGMNPLIETGYQHIPRLVYNGLTDYSPSPANKIVPALAESWQMSADAKTYTFKLRRGVKWHDGADFTSADVAFTYTKMSDPKGGSPFATLVTAVERVETPDAATAVIHLREPGPNFLAWTWLGILPRHVWEKEDLRGSEYNRKPIGTGPFRLVSWAKGDSMVFDANPTYFKGRPQIDRVILKVVPDPTVGFTALERGELDAFVFRGTVGGVPWPLVERLKKNPALVVNEFDVSSIQNLHLSTEHPALRHPKVRQAIAHAIDRQTVINNVLFGKGAIVHNPVVSPTFGPELYNPNVKQYEYDPAKANRILDEAGFPRAADGTRFKLVVYGTPGVRAQMNEIINENLRAVGIDTTMETYEWGTYDQKFRINREVQKRGIFSVLSTPKVPNPDDSLGFVYSKNAKIPAGRNFSEYVNPKVDQLIEQSRREADPGKRAAIYKELQVILADDLPMFPIYLTKGVDIWKKTIKGLVTAEFGGSTLTSLEGARIEGR